MKLIKGFMRCIFATLCKILIKKYRECTCMELKDIIELGKMGYTKTDIDALVENSNVPGVDEESTHSAAVETATEFANKIAELETAMKNLTSAMRTNAVRETVQTTSTENLSADAALQKIMGLDYDEK